MKPQKPTPPPGPIVPANPSIFRDNNLIESRPINFVFINGGLGDYINFCPALQWVQEQNPHVMGRIFVPPQFEEIAKFLFVNEKYPHWGVYLRDEFDRYYVPDSLVAAPREGTQLIGPPGAHLLDLGFMYYAQLFPPMPGYNFLPVIKYRDKKVTAFRRPAKYAVFTPGATAKNRQIPAKAFNHLVEFTKSQGLEIVYLGKKEIGPKGGAYKAEFNSEYNLNDGYDLREQTSLLEAIEIMEHAQFVIGLDNGLLHLAGTTEVPIIFGHTISPVRDRAIRRRKGLTINIEVPQSKLSCIGCQAKQRFFYNQRFSVCLYEDNLCTKFLFDNMKIWEQAIVQAINSNNKPFWRKK